MRLRAELVTYDVVLPEPRWQLFHCGFDRLDSGYWLAMVSSYVPFSRRKRGWYLTLEPVLKMDTPRGTVNFHSTPTA